MSRSKLDQALDTIDRVLSAWAAVRVKHHLSDEMVAYGKRVIQQAKESK